MVESSVVDAKSIRLNKFFYCPVFFQMIELRLCCNRYAVALRGFARVGGSDHPELGVLYAPCLTCSLRKTACERYHRPNHPVRSPRVAEEDMPRLRKLLKRRRILLTGE